MTTLRRFISDESGATAIEYSMIGALVSIAIIASVKKIGTNVSSKFGAVAGNLS